MKRRTPSIKKNSSASARPKRRYRVSLPHEETLEVEAASPEEAWQNYCRQRGILRSDHTPRIEAVE